MGRTEGRQQENRGHFNPFEFLALSVGSKHFNALTRPFEHASLPQHHPAPTALAQKQPIWVAFDADGGHFGGEQEP